MIPKELLEPRILRLKGRYEGFLLKYPFGAVAVPKVHSGEPLTDERIFPDIPTALRTLEIRRQDCVSTKQEPEKRYRVVASRNGRETLTEWLHAYMAAAIYIDRASWAIRLRHGLLLPFEFGIEDARTGIVAPPRTMGPLAAVKDVVHAVPPGDDRPDYIVQLPEGAAAIWTGPNPKEEWWKSAELVLLHHGLEVWPDATTSHHLPQYSIVRVAGEGFAVVAEGYHSVIHAGRICNWLLDESDIPCFVHDGNEPQGFDQTIMSGDMIRMSPDEIETFETRVEWNKVKLMPQDRCFAAVARVLEEPEPAGPAN